MKHDVNSGLVATTDCAPQPDIKAGSPPVQPVCVSNVSFRFGGTAGCKEEGNDGNRSKWGTNAKKRDQPPKANPLIFLVGQGGVEPPTLGFSVDH